MTGFAKRSVGICLAMSIAAACGASPADRVTTTPSEKAAPAIAMTSPHAPLKLRVPIEAIMLGTINEASKIVFRAGTSDTRLTDRSWTQVGAAAIELVGDASLITLPGTGPNDADWAADPRWLGHATEFQAASLAVGRAAARADAGELASATALLAQACQSCHADFSSRLLTSPGG